MTASRLRLSILAAALATVLLLPSPIQSAEPFPPMLEVVQQSRAQPPADLRLVDSDAKGVVLELDAPSYGIVSEAIGSALYHVVSAPGLMAVGRASEPALPVKAVLLGIPAGVDIEVEVLDVESEVLPGRYRIAPAPRPVVSEEAGWPELVGPAVSEDPLVYEIDGFYPPSPAQVTGIGYLRDQRLARLVLYPFQFNPVSGQLVHHRHLKVALRFRGAAPPGPPPRVPASQGPFEAVLANTVLNYESARAWRSDPTASALPLAATPQDAGSACKIDVEQDGIYEVTGTELQTAGCDLESADSHLLQMHNQGQEIAITVTAGQDGTFEGDDTVRFYGQGLHTKYSSTNVYWLTAGTSPGLRIQELDGHPADPAPVAEAFSTTVHVEQDHVYWPAPTPGSGRDYWFWERLRAVPGSPLTATYPLTLPSVASGTFTATLRVAVKSRYNEPAYDPDHHLRLYWNDGLLEDTAWDGEQVRLMTFQLPQSSVLDGANTLQAVLPADLGVPSDSIYLDWFEVDYYRHYTADGDRLFFASDTAGERRFEVTGFSQAALQLYDITQPAVPTQIVSATVLPVSDTFTLQFQATITSPRHYLALAADQVSRPARISLDTPSDLHSPDNGADYLILTPADFHTAAQTLADYRAGQGFRVAVVDVQDIYDEFSFGLFEPEAMQRFLAYAYAHWQEPPPSHVLLLGDGHLDFHDNLGIGETNYIPPYLDQVDPWLGETASDNRYVTVSGDDILPDMHIGRLPVASPAQALALVTKIIDYEGTPSPRRWQEQALFVADDADGAGDFARSSDAMAQHLPDSIDVDRVYYGLTHTVPSEATEAIVGAINGGRVIVNYVGHGAVQFWASERILDILDIGALINADRLPLMLPWTCYEGLFDYPGYPSLAESIVRAEGRGAVASWSPSGLGVPAAHEILASGFYGAVFADGLRALGPAATQAKLSLWAQAPDFEELIDTYVLLGDPATELALPRMLPYPVYLPLVLQRGGAP